MSPPLPLYTIPRLLIQEGDQEGVDHSHAYNIQRYSATAGRDVSVASAAAPDAGRAGGRGGGGGVEEVAAQNSGPPYWHEVVVKTMLHPVDGR